MFGEYLQDSHQFLVLAEGLADQGNDRKARRYYRASAFYASGAIEAFVNYIADSFVKAENIPQHEICFLTDQRLLFSVDKGLVARTEYHSVNEKVRFLIKKFAGGFDFGGLTWAKFMEFKSFRDSLVHPRQAEDETALQEYREKLRAGLRAIIEIMNCVSKAIFARPLRKQLLDLVPE